MTPLPASASAKSGAKIAENEVQRARRFGLRAVAFCGRGRGATGERKRLNLIFMRAEEVRERARRRPNPRCCRGRVPQLGQADAKAKILSVSGVPGSLL